jgi:hypothetical protein
VFTDGPFIVVVLFGFIMKGLDGRCLVCIVFLFLFLGVLMLLLLLFLVDKKRRWQGDSYSKHRGCFCWRWRRRRRRHGKGCPSASGEPCRLSSRHGPSAAAGGCMEGHGQALALSCRRRHGRRRWGQNSGRLSSLGHCHAPVTAHGVSRSLYFGLCLQLFLLIMKKGFRSSSTGSGQSGRLSSRHGGPGRPIITTSTCICSIY